MQSCNKLWQPEAALQCYKLQAWANFVASLKQIWKTKAKQLKQTAKKPKKVKALAAVFSKVKEEKEYDQMERRNIAEFLKIF